MEGDSILKKQKSRNLGRDSDLVDLYNQFRRMWGTSKLFIYEYDLRNVARIPPHLCGG